MDNHSVMLHAYSLADSQGALEEQAAIEAIKADSPAWVNLHADHPDTGAWLAKHAGYLPAPIIEALLAEETRPRCEVLGQGVLLILRGVNMAQGADPEDMVSIRLWIDPHRVISLHRRSLEAIKHLDARYKSENGPRDSASFVSQLIAELLNVMEPVLQEVDECVDDLEEKLMESPSSSLRHDLALIRRRALLLKRYISPQREAISKFRNAPLDWLSTKDRLQLQEHYDRITRFVEHLDAVRERCQIIQDELTTIMADKLNRNSYILTLVAAIFLPLGFITGLLGINVGGMPGVERGDAFLIVCGVCIAILLAELWLFKRLKWF